MHDVKKEELCGLKAYEDSTRGRLMICINNRMAQ